MNDSDRPQARDPGTRDAARGEFDDLLRQIEKEPVPERLLELALKLQAALIERQTSHGRENGDDD